MLVKNLSNLTLMSPDGVAQGGGASGTAAGGQSQTGGGTPNAAQTIFGGSDDSAAGQNGDVDGAGDQGDGSPDSQGQGGAAAASGQSGTPPNTIPLDAVEKIVQSLAKANLGQQQQASQQQAPQMTQEEFDKTFNVFRPSADLIAQMRDENPEVALGAIQTLVSGVVKQASTLAAFHTMQEMQRIQQTMAPAMQFVESQQMERMKNEFFEAYPNLKGLEPLLLQIRDSLIKEGANFKSKEDAFKAVAERAQGILSKVPGYTGGSTSNNNGGGQGTASGQTGNRRMPTLSGKGQGGGVGGKGSAATKSTAERIFGPR